MLAFFLAAAMTGMARTCRRRRSKRASGIRHHHDTNPDRQRSGFCFWNAAGKGLVQLGSGACGWLSLDELSLRHDQPLIPLALQFKGLVKILLHEGAGGVVLSKPHSPAIR